MITIREAKKGDGALVFRFIHELANYEKLAHEVASSAEQIEANLFCHDARAHALIAENNGQPVGLALYFYNFSTFLGRHGIYIEDLYVQPEARGYGIGRKLFEYIAAKAKREGCGRVEWWVLDWNKSAIDFYERMGAKPMSEWTVYRLEGEALDALATAATEAA